MSNQIFTLKFNKPGGKVVIVELPLSTWTIINTNTLSISGDTITQTGVGGWQEEMYKAFSVPTTGSYTITYDYDIESGYVGDWAYYGFGLFLSPNNPNVSDHYQFYANSSNRVGTVIANPSTNIEGMKGTVSFTATLTGNTTYYLWYPGGALGDGTTYHLTFKNIDICNNPIQYLDGDAVPLRYTTRMLSYNYIEPAYKRYLWKFTGATGRLGWKQFQIAAIKVNDISLPYTYITSGISAGSSWSDSGPGNFVDSNESNKWGGGTTESGTIDGWYIFDLPSAVIPTKYSLKTGDDTNYEDRNPRNGMLYGSLGTPTTTSDSSWVLLDSRALNLPRSNLVWTSYTLNKV